MSTTKTVEFICKDIPDAKATSANPESSRVYKIPNSATGDYMGMVAYDCSQCGGFHTTKIPIPYVDILVGRGWGSATVLPGDQAEEMDFAEIFGRREALHLGNGVEKLLPLDPTVNAPIVERALSGVFTVPPHIAARERSIEASRDINEVA